MNQELILQIAGWAGGGALLVFAIASAYRDIVEILYEKNIPLPKQIEESLYSRKKKEISHILDEMGVKSYSDQYKQVSHMIDILEKRPSANYKQELDKILALSFVPGSYDVGKTYSQKFNYFIDLTGTSTDFVVAERCARVLANFIRDEIKLAITNEGRKIVYNKIIVPKSGSPAIGLYLGQILHVPCVFFRGNEEPKVRGSNDTRVFFDGSVEAGDNFILVDDSTTGGRMFNQAVEKLRDAHAEISHAFILFEPIGKDARGRLLHSNVELHSIVKMDENTVSRLLDLSRKLKN